MSAPIEARVHAPTAPMWQRVIAYSIGWSFILAGLIALNSFPSAGALLATGAWTLVLAPFFLYRRRPQNARITLFPGRLVIYARRSLPRTIHTRDLRGAFVSRSGDRLVLSLEEKSSRHSPIAIALTDERAMKDVRKSLGIRHEGFGEVSWRTGGRIIDTLILFARIAAVLTLTSLWTSAASIMWIAPLLNLLLLSVLWVSSAVSRNPAIVVDRSGTHAAESSHPFSISWGDLEAVDQNDDGISLHTKGGVTFARCKPNNWLRFGVSQSERDVLVAQLRGGGARAREANASSFEDVPDVAQFTRGDAPVLEWLARLDALAATRTEKGYRGVEILEEELWRAFENYETAAEVRAAAGRFLFRVSPEKQARIASTLESIHDDAERTNIRAALDSDLESAAFAIEQLDEVKLRHRS